MSDEHVADNELFIFCIKDISTKKHREMIKRLRDFGRTIVLTQEYLGSNIQDIIESENAQFIIIDFMDTDVRYWYEEQFDSIITRQLTYIFAISTGSEDWIDDCGGKKLRDIPNNESYARFRKRLLISKHIRKPKGKLERYSKAFISFLQSIIKMHFEST